MTTPDRRHHRPPTRASVVGLTFGIWALAIPLLFHGRVLNGDGDPARHLMIGGHILGHGPRFADPFSFSRAGEPFLAYEWLSQAMYAVVHAVAGLPGVAAMAGLLLAGSFALVVAYVRRDGGDPWLAFIVGASAAVLTSPHWLARPHLFSFVALGLLLHVLGRHRIIWLIPLFALWANLHPGFLYGLIMVAVWSLGRGLEDLRAGGRWRQVAARAAPFGLALAASFLNPFGWTLHAHALSWVGSETAALTNEFMPLAVFSPYGLGLLAAIGLVVVGFAAQREWVGWPTLLVFGAAVVGALAVRRNGPMLAMFALPMAARALTPVVQALPSWAFGRMRTEFARSDAPGWRVGPGAAALLLAVLAIDAMTSRIALIPREFSADVFPAAAIRHARDAGLEGRLLSEYTWGGYVLYTWPGPRIFVDSMADFFGDDLIREYAEMAFARPAWGERLAEREISLALFAPGAPLVRELRRAPGWRVAHEDDVAVLLVRDDDADGAGTADTGPAT